MSHGFLISLTLYSKFWEEGSYIVWKVKYKHNISIPLLSAYLPYLQLKLVYTCRRISPWKPFHSLLRLWRMFDLDLGNTRKAINRFRAILANISRFYCSPEKPCTWRPAFSSNPVDVTANICVCPIANYADYVTELSERSVEILLYGRANTLDLHFNSCHYDVFYLSDTNG